MGAPTKQKVVIKTLKPGSSKIAARDLDRELEVLKVLHHSNIVELFGAGHTPQVWLLSNISNTVVRASGNIILCFPCSADTSRIGNHNINNN